MHCSLEVFKFKKVRQINSTMVYYFAIECCDLWIKWWYKNKVTMGNISLKKKKHGKHTNAVAFNLIWTKILDALLEEPPF
jgi:hypothetical protein